MIRRTTPTSSPTIRRCAARVEALAAKTCELTEFLVNVLKLDARAGTLRRHGHLPRLLRRPARDGRQGAAARAARQGARRRSSPRWPNARPAAASAARSRSSSARSRRGSPTTSAGTSRQRGADAVVLGDLGCMLNIEGRLRRRGDTKTKVLHVAEVLAGDEPRPAGRVAMQVASMHFKERAHVKLQRRAAAAQPQEDQGQVRRQAARVAGRARRLRGHARRRQGDPPARARQPRRLARDLRAQRRRRAARRCCWRRRRPTSTRWCSRSRRSTACAKIIKSKSMVSRGVGARPRDRGRRPDGRRDRPRRIHPADQRLRAAVAHHRPGAAQEQGGGRRALPQDARHAASRPGIEELCLEARGVLREHYLTADMGISGGNFFVAETGSVVLVTNEGNATLTTTLPKVHVAISGIEKIVPDAGGRRDADAPAAALGDRPVDLELRRHPDRRRRARASSTAPSTCTSSSSTAGAPRCSASDVREALRCIRCGACMNHCPVYQNIGGHSYGWVYPGPIGSILTPMYVGLENALDLPHGVDAVQPVRRRLPGEDSAARPAAQAAREGVRARPAAVARARRPARCGRGSRSARRSTRSATQHRRARAARRWAAATA